MYYSARGCFELKFSEAEEMGVYTVSTIAKLGDHICARTARDPVWHHGIRRKDSVVYDVVGESDHRAKVRQSSMDAFVAGAVVCAIIRYDGDSDDCRGASLGVAQYLCDEVGEHPAAYSMVCGSHESFATWCRMLRRHGEGLETTFKTVSSKLETIGSQHLRGIK